MVICLIHHRKSTKFHHNIDKSAGEIDFAFVRNTENTEV